MDPVRRVYTVSRLNREVRLLLEHGLPVVWVEGELSNVARPSSGHWYFSLKDGGAQVRCAMFRQRNTAVGFVPREGLAVLVRGRVGLYEPRGDYQLIAEHMEEAGLGRLRQAFDQLKAKLAAEGLFDAARKRPLPGVPRRIAIVTSPSGAALRDILHILGRRFPSADVLIYPTPVQGTAAAREIAAAIALASARADCDVLIVARGGGSLEDLWAFNEEPVARAIAACAIPVVTGVGHEVDVTIADFAADVRAPTPSGAAQLVVPDRGTWLARLARLEMRFAAGIARAVREDGARLARLRERMRLADPRVRLAEAAQRLDELEQRLARAWRAERLAARARLDALAARLSRQAPATRLHALAAVHATLGARLHHAMGEHVAAASHRLGLASRALQAMSPLATLGRGFAIVTRGDTGALVVDARSVSDGDPIEARLAQGSIRARVTGRS
jgi:exodeoxyribonuclease VII large subunit